MKISYVDMNLLEICLCDVCKYKERKDMIKCIYTV